VKLGWAGALAFAVGLAFDDEFVAGGGEPVDGGLGEGGGAHEGDPFVGGAGGGDDGGFLAGPVGGVFVGVGGGGFLEGGEAKSSRMRMSVAASRRCSASVVLSRRAALRRLNSCPARVMWTVRRRRMAMWPRAVARWVLPTPTGPRM